MGWGADGGWMPLPTRPQRYCDPASLVTILLGFTCGTVHLFKEPEDENESICVAFIFCLVNIIFVCPSLALTNFCVT